MATKLKATHSGRFKKGENPHHPRIGSSIKVEPIREAADIKAIKQLLSNRARDLALFTNGVNIGLRASDLSRITVGQAKQACSGDGHITVKTKKTGKSQTVVLNGACCKAIKQLLTEQPDLVDKSPLFQTGAPSLSRNAMTARPSPPALRIMVSL